MAGDWIKMRTDLYRDPKVSVIADALLARDSELAIYINQHFQRDMTITRNVMRNVTVGALVSVWGVMRQRGKRNGDDLECKGVTLVVLDDIADVPGFGEALALSGWVEQTEDGLVFPRFFDEYNVSPDEKARSQGAERQRQYRLRKAQKDNVTSDVTSNVTVTPREEKNRDIPPNPQMGEGESISQQPNASPQKAKDPEGFERFWQAWPKSERKQARGQCLKAWQKAGAEKHAEEVLVHVERMKLSESWTKEAGQFVPAPLVYLNQRRWEGADETGQVGEGSAQSKHGVFV